MNTASLELSRELYELSNWDSRDELYHDEGYISGAQIPFYDLGYLLRKIAEVEQVQVKTWGKRWYASIFLPIENRGHDSPTPEDALCKLAIELFKQGILPQPKAPIREKIEKIYLRRLPNPDTGLYDIKSSIDDIEALIIKEVRAARIDEHKLVVGMATTLSETGLTSWSDEHLAELSTPPNHIDRGSGFTHSDESLCACLEEGAKEDVL